MTATSLEGPDATEFLAEWIRRLRVAASLQAVALGGITIAGLGVVDVRALSRSAELPVLVTTRREPRDALLCEALASAGLGDRVPLVRSSPRAVRLEEGLYLAHAGARADEAERLVRATLRKSLLPEPLRVAHLVAAALVGGESRGRV